MEGFAIVVGTLGALALVIEKVVSAVRHIVDPAGKAPTVVWNILALVVGVGAAFGWDLNLAPSFVALIPAAEHSSALSGSAGNLLTGLVLGAGSGFAYGILQSLEATVHRNENRAAR